MNRTLYVGNLPMNFEEIDLEYLFKNYGNIVSAKVFNHAGSEWAGKFGYVELASVSEADKAIIELNNHNVIGRRITVSHILAR
jgi:RNA recognition motif-containing protein